MFFVSITTAGRLLQSTTPAQRHITGLTQLRDDV